MGNTVYFDHNGDPPAIYELFNKHLGVDGKLHTTAVGIFNSSASQGRKLEINESAIRWNGGARVVCAITFFFISNRHIFIQFDAA